MVIGAHVSISGGMHLAIERGETIGADCIQTFASPPRTLQFSPLSDEVRLQYLEKRALSSIKLHVFHAVYLVNLANENPEYVNASMASLISYQQAATQLNVLGTIVHVGSHKGAGFDSCKARVGQALAHIISESPSNTMLLLENAAGHKGTIGQTIDELTCLFEEVDKINGNVDNLGLCLDTQHAFASGVDGRDRQALDTFLSTVDASIGLSKVKVIHLNDSKVICESHKDRHENIGNGELGPIGIQNWLQHPRLTHLPFILEVPGVDGKGPGAADIACTRAFVEK